ncbi:hypothetical protein ACLSZY_08565 [Avibacterium volantium]|uniref:hypothetical protein n=1 Tax=Avibacterium TaxID=292486 RepID=UPI0039FD1B05
MVDNKTSKANFKINDYMETIKISRPKYILYVITNENTWEDSFHLYNVWGIGTHTGMILENTQNKSESLLYDPSGSYFFKRESGEIIYPGSGYTLSGDDFSFEGYINYQKEDGEDVYAHIFYLSDEEGERIKNNIEADRRCGPMGCTECSSEVLKGGTGKFKNLEITSRPNQLGNQLRKLSDITIKL